jgi:hypothetical protein
MFAMEKILDMDDAQSSGSIVHMESMAVIKLKLLFLKKHIFFVNWQRVEMEISFMPPSEILVASKDSI